MREGGFEPPKALSHRILSPAHLTTLLPSHEKTKNPLFKNSLLLPLLIKL